MTRVDPALDTFQVLDTHVKWQRLTAHILSASTTHLSGGLLSVTLHHEPAFDVSRLNVHVTSNQGETEVRYSPGPYGPIPEEDMPYRTRVWAESPGIYPWDG